MDAGGTDSEEEGGGSDEHLLPVAEGDGDGDRGEGEGEGEGEDVVIPCEFCDEPVWMSTYETHVRRCRIRHRIMSPPGHGHTQIMGMTQDMWRNLMQAVRDADQQRIASAATSELVGSEADVDAVAPELPQTRRYLDPQDEFSDGGDEDEGPDGLVRRAARRSGSSSGSDNDDDRGHGYSQSQSQTRTFTQTHASVGAHSSDAQELMAQRLATALVTFPTLLTPARMDGRAMTQLVNSLRSALASHAHAHAQGHGDRGHEDYEDNLLLTERMGGPHCVGVSCLDAVTSVIVHDPAQGQEEMCPICQEIIAASAPPSGGGGRVARKTRCGHLFCGECIGTWLRQSKKCPVCMTHLEDMPVPSAAFPASSHVR